jgi:hypothetical protein
MYTGVDTGNNYVYFGTNTANYGISFQASGDRMRIFNDGNVSINNTSNAGFKLDVNGTGRFSGLLTVNGGAIGNNIARFTTGGAGGGTRGLTISSNDSQVKLQVTDNAGSVGSWAFLNLNPDGGNVGIGTTNPTARLDVNGDVNIGGLNISGAVGGGPSMIAVFKPLNPLSVNSGYQFQLNPAGGAYGGFSVTNVDPGINQTLLQLAAQSLSGDSYINVPSTAQNISLRVSGTPYLYIKGTTGNVLIGTTSDNGHRLRIEGNTYSSGYMYTASEGTGFVVEANPNPALGRVGLMKYGGLEGMLTSGSSTAIRLGHRTDSEYVLAGGTPTFRVDLLIATDGVATFSSNVNAPIFTSTGGRGTSFGFRLPDWQIYNTSSGNSLAFNNYTTDLVTITSVGNVLIGTTTIPTPVSGVAFPLTVSSSAATRIRIDSTNASPNSGVGLYANGVQKFSFAMYGATSDFTIYNDALLASALLVKGTNSNVLIGTTTDVGAKLYVNGAFRTGTLTAGTQTAAVDWRLGNARGGAATNNALIRVQINGVLVDLLGNYV